MTTKKDILKQLEKFSCAKGSVVLLHTSLKTIGETEGGAEGLLEALIEFFTKNDGLLCVPTHTWETRIMDMNKADCCIGAFANIAALFKGGVRSLHPTHSMTVFGRKERAQEFVCGEELINTPTSPLGCYGKIYNENGYILLAGVGHTKNTFLHCVEEMLHVPDRLTEETVEASIIHKDGTREKRRLHWFDSKIPDVSVNFGKFEPAFRYHGCVVDGFIGNAPAQLCSAEKMKNVMELIYKNSGGRELLADNEPLEKRLYGGRECNER